jgi:hypothetical protein
MCIVAASQNAEPSSVGAAWVSFGPDAGASPIHAAPTELGGQSGTHGYKHGAPNGAVRTPAAAPRICKRPV